MVRKISLFIFSLSIVLCFLTACFAKEFAHKDQGSVILPAAYLPSKYFPLLEGKKIGVMANHTSEVRGTHLVDTLLSAGMDVVKIFSPEHGFRGTADAGEIVGNAIDKKTGLPIISLYGNKVKPTQDDLEGLDVLIFDIQDVGVRFFTYLTSLHYLMEACAAKNIPLVLLDRPNPNGFYIDGPVLKPAYKSFVGIHPVPVVYGMTIGEYALMINGEYWLEDSMQCNLSVIPCENYTHSSHYELPVKPSPNLPDMRSIYLYPSIALFEGTFMSEGRGTMTPFQLIGHPEYPDTNFSFIPKAIPGMSKSPKFKNVVCYGLDLRDISLIFLKEKQTMQFEWLLVTYQAMQSDDFFNPFFNNLTGDSRVKTAIESGADLRMINLIWQNEMEAFKAIRKKYLIYP